MKGKRLGREGVDSPLTQNGQPELNMHRASKVSALRQNKDTIQETLKSTCILYNVIFSYVLSEDFMKLEKYGMKWSIDFP